MKQSKLRIDKIFYIFFLITATLGLAYTFDFRQIDKDGSNWIFSIINNQTWHFEDQHLRLSTLLIQIPSVLSSKFFTNQKIALWLFCFSYFVFPVITYFISRNYLKKKNQLSLIYTFYAVFFLAILPSWGFAVGVVNEAICLFYLLYIQVKCEKKLNSFYFFILFFLLVFSYELGLILAVYILFLAIKQNQLTKVTSFLIGSFFLFQAINILFNIIPNGATSSFIVLPFIKKIILPFSFLLLFCFLFLLSHLNRKKINACINYFYISFFISQVVAIICLFVFFARNQFFNWYDHFPELYKIPWNNFFEFYFIDPFLNRIWAIPGTFLLVLVIEFVTNKKGEWSQRQKAILLSLAIPMVFSDFIYAFNFHYSMKIIKDLTQSKNGCQTIQRAEYDKLFLQTNIKPGEWTLPQTSLLLQANLTPKSILFVENDINNIKSSCKLNFKKELVWMIDQNNSTNISTIKRYNFKNMKLN